LLPLCSRSAACRGAAGHRRRQARVATWLAPEDVADLVDPDGAARLAVEIARREPSHSPFGVAPISANAIRLAHNRSPLTSRLRAGIAPTRSRYPSIPRNLINAALPACIVAASRRPIRCRILDARANQLAQKFDDRLGFLCCDFGEGGL
jgi:hypothetical protein